MKRQLKLILVGLTSFALISIALYHLLPASLFPNMTPVETPSQEMEISYPIAAWSWQSPAGYTPESAAKLAGDLSNAHVSTIYVDISAAVDLKDSDDSDGLKEFKQKLKTFVQALTEKNIDVQGLAGGKNWADPSYRYLNTYTVEFIREYNSEVNESQKLTGIHFDTEPFSTESFDQAKEDSLIQFIEMVNETKKELQQNTENPRTQLELGYSIPYWLDGQNKNIPKITWNGKTDYLFYHIADELKDYGNGYLAIMAYRNYAYGTDGTIELVKKEIEYTKNSSVRIIVGQELNNEEPAKITFFGKSKRELLTELYEINEMYKYDQNFQGFAIHEVKSLLPYFN